ncbi:MAG: hypothetical protein PHG20_12840, partial [Geobacteraceae bacterium]|nr:hypothetical protein [Geobacteraceae bacterium]
AAIFQRAKSSIKVWCPLLTTDLTFPETMRLNIPYRLQESAFPRQHSGNNPMTGQAFLFAMMLGH